MSFLRSNSDISKVVLNVVLDNELSKVQSGHTSCFSGRDLCSLACASSLRLGKHLGLIGDLAPLLLRWGHCSWSMERSLTCCPERRELLRDMRANDLARLFQGHALVEVLYVGGQLRVVSPDWLKSHIEPQFLVESLRRGGHLPNMSPAWLVGNLACDHELVYALQRGGHLGGLSVEWMTRHIKTDSGILGAMVASDKLWTASTEWFEERFRVFADLVTAFCLIDHVPAMEWLFGLYDRVYRGFLADTYGANDLVDALVSFSILGNKLGALTSYDIESLVHHLRGVEIGQLMDVVATADELTGASAVILAMRPRESSEQTEPWVHSIYFFLNDRGWAQDRAVMDCASLISTKLML